MKNKNLFLRIVVVTLLTFTFISGCFGQSLTKLDSIRQKQILILNANYMECKDLVTIKQNTIDFQEKFIQTQADTINKKIDQNIVLADKLGKSEKKKERFKNISIAASVVAALELSLLIFR